MSTSLEHAKQVVNDAAHWLRAQQCERRILVKQTRNLGDTLHITPIARHYKTKFPGCKIAFIVGRSYASVHELNQDFDKLFLIDNALDPQERIQLKRFIDEVVDLDLKICPSIFPFGEVWESHKWSYPIINQQIFVNAQIKLDEMLGDKLLHAPIDDNDRAFAEKFIGNNKCIGLEFNSYSHTPSWHINHFSRLTRLLKERGFRTISFGALHEGIIPGAMDGRGITWRRTIAILEKCKYMIGIGSGITMLAACARPTPHIIEMGVSEAISMRNCNYANSTLLSGNLSPEDVVHFILATERGNK